MKYIQHESKPDDLSDYESNKLKVKNSVIEQFNDTGFCYLNINETIKQWNNDCCISQWHDEYRFHGLGIKININPRQAIELIVELKLNKLQSPIFKNAKIWRTENIHK